MSFCLAVTLPAAFALGVAIRAKVPTSHLPIPGVSDENRNQRALWTRTDLWEKLAIETRLLTFGSAPSQVAIQLIPTVQIVRPDVLVYWVAGEGKLQMSLPDDAFLLGSFDSTNPRSFPLPGVAPKQTGSLVLYSLADQEIIAVSKPFSASQ
jgi:hypothetical protein